MTSSLFVQIRAADNGVKYSAAGAVFAVDGTVYPGAPWPPIPGTGAGFSSDWVGGLINVQDGLWYSETIGYPAVTTPMWPSAQIGQHNLGFRIKAYADGYQQTHGGSLDGLVILISGYSQGAIVTDLTWTIDILPTNGYLHYLLPYIWRIYNFGDPLRCPGISHGNDSAGLPGPGTLDGVVTGGVGGPQDLRPEQTNVVAPDGKFVVQSCNNKGDLYGAAPMGPTPWVSMPAAGKVEYGFFRIIMKPGFVDIVEVGGDLFHPIGAIEGATNAIKFFGAGTNAPHWLYQEHMIWAINDALAIGANLPHQIGY